VPVTEIAESCLACHDGGGPEAAVGEEIERRLSDAEAELEAAGHAIEGLVERGREAHEARARYRAALTDFRQMEQVQHSLDLEVLEDLALRLGSSTGIIRAEAEVAAEEQWEHKFLLIPVWFLVLAAVTLAWFKLRELR